MPFIAVLNTVILRLFRWSQHLAPPSHDWCIDQSAAISTGPTGPFSSPLLNTAIYGLFNRPHRPSPPSRDPCIGCLAPSSFLQLHSSFLLSSSPSRHFFTQLLYTSLSVCSRAVRFSSRPRTALSTSRAINSSRSYSITLRFPRHASFHNSNLQMLRMHREGRS